MFMFIPNNMHTYLHNIHTLFIFIFKFLFLPKMFCAGERGTWLKKFLRGGTLVQIV